MKFSYLLWAIFFSHSLVAFGLDFPIAPNSKLTPGKICDHPVGYRYPEKIPYCGRDVSYNTKEILIERYDTILGYKIRSMNRYDFKIDHLIPLCAGGANDTSNLWPQHKSVYEITDPVEPLICQKMLEGKLLQIDAIKLILKAKTNLNQVGQIIRYLEAL